MILAAFKTEVDAVSTPPMLFFEPTLENFAAVEGRISYVKYATNSVIEAGGSTILALLIGIPAAYAMAFFPSKRTKNTLVWMLSTKMMPAVGALMPLYLIFRDTGLLDRWYGLVIIYTMINLPIVIWMLFSFFRDIPPEILEAGRIDGASPMQEIRRLLLPMALPGIASTALLSMILTWNEAFWSLKLTTAEAGPLPAFISSFSSPEGLFWAKLSAASLMAIAPILVAGWLSQKQLVRGLTFGAVK
jgi:sorbitol/mannitol transport system permease protein